MDSEIAADAKLDYVTFQILPENRYGACICSEEKEEIVGDGPLEQLLEHLPYIKDQIVKGFCDNFKLELPNSIGDSSWFTKATLTRFLHMIGSPEVLNKSIAVSNEMSQLEETRKFHLSLYTQADRSTSSDNSKDELLRAMDSRIAALTEELFSTFNLLTGAAISIQEMIDLQGFCQHFGDVDLRNLLLKLSERSQKGQTIVSENKKKPPIPFMSKSDFVNKASGNTQILGQANSLKPVQYNASPAKAAEIERQDSSGSDDSSFSSEDDQPSAAERSRTLIRSASPRRSASPMRKVQIGRTGSRRTPALTIKSLPHFPARERIPTHRDTENDCISDEFEEPSKKAEINVSRISVQDAISLFENKQRDQTVESQKKSATDISMDTNKAVLRRWSSGMSDSQRSMTQNTLEHTVSKNDAVGEDAPRSSEVKLVSVPTSINQDLEGTMKTDTEFEESKNMAVNPSEDDGPLCQTEEETCDKLDSAQWSRQKEEELNKMLMKFAEYNLSNHKNTEPDDDKNHISRLGQSAGFNGHRKERRDAKLNGEKSGKRIEKQSSIKTKQRVADKPKPENSSAKVGDIGKKLPASRTLNVNRAPVSLNSKKESLKPVVQKKVPSRCSPLPATRKSWPSTPSPRVTGPLPTKSSIIIPTSVPRQKSQSVAPRQKPQSPGPGSRPNPKLEKPQMQQKAVKKQQVDTRKSLKKADDGKSRAVPKSTKTTKIKTGTTPEEIAAAADAVAVAVSPTKAVMRKKVTKKSSVVPLEVKSSVRKVSEKSPAKSLASKKRDIPPQVEETFSKSEDHINDAENSEIIHQAVSQEFETQNGHLELQIESETENPENVSEKEIFVEAPAQGDEGDEQILESPAIIQIQPAQESLISPAAWVESNPQDTDVPISDSSISSLTNSDAVVSSGARVRHSLSQMLLEESSEPDIIEWGNAEHPPSMVYQKDAPKGLKRLLKFARKNKEANGVAWASPYASEGEEDGDEYRNLGKRNSDNLLKVALHSKNYAEGFLSDSEPHSARSNASNSSARSSNKFQEGHASSKGPRSFFSLSAFRGKN